MDINKIKVNGEIFNINTIHVSPEEPQGNERTALWVKPIVKNHLSGPTQYYDNELSQSMYATFNRETQELTWQAGYPTSSPVICLQSLQNAMESSQDTYGPFRLVNEANYKCIHDLSSTLYVGMTYGVIYLDENKTFISMEEHTIEDVNVKRYETDLTIPEGAAYAVPFIDLKGTTTSNMWFTVYMCLNGYTYDDSGLFYLMNDTYTRLI